MNLKFNDLLALINEAPISSYLRKPTTTDYRKKVSQQAKQAQADYQAQGGGQQQPPAQPGFIKNVAKATGRAALSGLKKGATNLISNPGNALQSVISAPGKITSGLKSAILGGDTSAITGAIQKGAKAIGNAGQAIGSQYGALKDQQMAKALGIRTENPANGQPVSVDLGKSLAAGLGVKLISKLNNKVNFQGNTVYDIPVTGNAKMDAIKIVVGKPNQDAVTIIYNKSGMQIPNPEQLGLATQGYLRTDPVKPNSWLLTDKQPAKPEEFGFYDVDVNPKVGSMFTQTVKGRSVRYQIIGVDDQAERFFALPV
jgi:hypothetical protein